MPPYLPVTLMVGGEEHYQVENIMSYRSHSKRRQYLVDWMGLNGGENTWCKNFNLAQIYIRILTRDKQIHSL